MGAFGFNRNDKETAKVKKRQERLNKRAERRQWARDRKVRREIYDRGISIIALVFLILIAGAMLAHLQNNDIPTFTSFLEFLQTVPAIDLDWAVIPMVTNDWGIFQWAAKVFNVISPIINFFGFITKSAINCVMLILWFLGYFMY